MVSSLGAQTIYKNIENEIFLSTILCNGVLAVKH